MSTVIKVESLGKKYTLSHQQQGENTSLREAITNSVASLGRKILSPFPRCSSSLSASPGIEDFWALKDVSFEVRQGERIGIIGRNGAGKSTLLKILSRITEPTTGRVKIKGRVASLLEVGTGFHPELTGRENIFLNGAILGMSRQEIRRKFDEIVAFSEIEKFLDTPVKRYSSGMYVRLAFAVAAHLEPEILIVDEVLAVGDAAFQKKCLGKMEEVGREGRTVLFVSHNMAAVQHVCEKAMLLEHGNSQEIAATAEVVGLYLRKNVESAMQPLEWRKDRQGDGSIRFVGFSLQNDRGETVEHFIAGSDACLMLFYKSPAIGITLDDVRIALRIDSLSGERLAHLSMEVSSNTFDGLLGSEGTIELRIPRLPLMPGMYLITLFSTVKGRIADWVQHAATVYVAEGDYFKTGRLPPAAQGFLLMDHSFSIRNR